jgi:hypothetical protein
MLNDVGGLTRTEAYRRINADAEAAGLPAPFPTQETPEVDTDTDTGGDKTSTVPVITDKNIQVGVEAIKKEYDLIKEEMGTIMPRVQHSQANRIAKMNHLLEKILSDDTNVATKKEYIERLRSNLRSLHTKEEPYQEIEQKKKEKAEQKAIDDKVNEGLAKIKAAKGT